MIRLVLDNNTVHIVGRQRGIGGRAPKQARCDAPTEGADGLLFNCLPCALDWAEDKEYVVCEACLSQKADWYSKACRGYGYPW